VWAECRVLISWSSYLTGNTLRLHNNAQPVKAVYGNNRCLLWEPYGTHTYCQVHRVQARRKRDFHRTSSSTFLRDCSALPRQRECCRSVIPSCHFLYMHTFIRIHKLTVIYNRCWNWPPSACKHASHRINKLCDTFPKLVLGNWTNYAFSCAKSLNDFRGSIITKSIANNNRINNCKNNHNKNN
jgi:hypothetical protein